MDFIGRIIERSARGGDLLPRGCTAVAVIVVGRFRHESESFSPDVIVRPDILDRFSSSKKRDSKGNQRERKRESDSSSDSVGTTIRYSYRLFLYVSDWIRTVIPSWLNEIGVDRSAIRSARTFSAVSPRRFHNQNLDQWSKTGLRVRRDTRCLSRALRIAPDRMWDWERHSRDKSCAMPASATRKAISAGS